MPVAKFYAVVTFGRPAKTLPPYVTDKDRAIRLAGEALRTGTCTDARVYECDTKDAALNADISEVRDGQRRVWMST